MKTPVWHSVGMTIYGYARGRADAKAKGVKFGRKKKLTPHQQLDAIQRRDVEGETLRSIGRSYNVSAATIGRLSS
jgi:DNA invertase Pin-like site-specific DNA recombinase